MTGVSNIQWYVIEEAIIFVSVRTEVDKNPIPINVGSKDSLKNDIFSTLKQTLRTSTIVKKKSLKYKENYKSVTTQGGRHF